MANTKNDARKVNAEDEDTTASDVVDNSYASDNKNEPIPVVKDEDVEQTDAVDPDSDKALEKDDKDAIDTSNIIEGDRTRNAAKPKGTYREPGDEEGLPGPDDGTSNVRGPGVEGAYDNKPNAPSPFV